MYNRSRSIISIEIIICMYKVIIIIIKVIADRMVQLNVCPILNYITSIVIYIMVLVDCDVQVYRLFERTFTYTMLLSYKNQLIIIYTKFDNELDR